MKQRPNYWNNSDNVTTEKLLSVILNTNVLLGVLFPIGKITLVTFTIHYFEQWLIQI